MAKRVDAKQKRMESASGGCDQLGELSAYGHPNGGIDAMGKKWHIRQVVGLTGGSDRHRGAEQPVRAKARSVAAVAAVSALLGAGVGLGVTAARPAGGPGAGALAGGPANAALTALILPTVVAPLGRLSQADLLVIAPASIRARTRTAIGKLPGVAATQSVEAGTLTVQNTSALVLGVNPSTFRGYTPKATAASTPLWQSVANGAIVVSTALGQQDRLSARSVVSVAGARQERLRVGSVATLGIAGVSAVVSGTVAHALGMPAGNALVISAPHANLASLIIRVEAMMPASTRIEPLISQPAGLVSQAEITTMVYAALSRVGRPYVYGADGPNAFDCSGLVQWSFARAGVSVPRVAAAQAMTGPVVPVAQLEPGDLLFYHTDPADPGYISHVAIYIGGGKMVQAPHTGENVQVVLANTTWDFAFAVRVNLTIAAGLAG